MLQIHPAIPLPLGEMSSVLAGEYSRNPDDWRFPGAHAPQIYDAEDSSETYRMQTEIHLEAIDTHTGGMPTRIVSSGLNRSKQVDGTVEEKRDAFADEQDDIRKLLVQEPRGHKDMFGAVPTEPADPEADLGLFFMDTGGYLDMCGHGTMGVVTALIETNRLSPAETVTIETPAGLVEASPEMADGRVERVGVQNVRSYVVDAVSVDVGVDGTERTIEADIVYAGNYFAMLPSDQVEMAVDTSNTAEFIDWGLAIRSAINEELSVTDPLSGDPIEVDLTEFYDGSGPVDRNIVVFGDGAVDRSACGTGTCAKMTLLHEKGELDLEEPYPHESVIGTRFEGELLEAETTDGVTVTTPEVRGSAHIVADHTFVLDETDPTPSFSVFDR